MQFLWWDTEVESIYIFTNVYSHKAILLPLPSILSETNFFMFLFNFIPVYNSQRIQSKCKDGCFDQLFLLPSNINYLYLSPFLMEELRLPSKGVPFRVYINIIIFLHEAWKLHCCRVVGHKYSQKMWVLDPWFACCHHGNRLLTRAVDDSSGNINFCKWISFMGGPMATIFDCCLLLGVLQLHFGPSWYHELTLYFSKKIISTVILVFMVLYF